MDQWGMDNSVKKETHMLKYPCHFPSCHKWILKIAARRYPGHHHTLN
jgi:hypothetical protein